MADRFSARDLEATGISSSGGAITGTLDVNTIDAGQLTSDTAPTNMVIQPESAYDRAAVNTSGAHLYLHAGTGRRFFTAVSVAAGAVTLNFTDTKRAVVSIASGVDFALGANVAALATNIAACINAHATLSAEMTATHVTIGGPTEIVYLREKDGYYQLAISSSNAGAVTATVGTNGLVVLPINTVFSGGQAATSCPGINVSGNGLRVCIGQGGNPTATTSLAHPISGTITTAASVAVSAILGESIYTNTGAGAQVNHTLPSAVASLYLQYSFYNQQANGIRITAAAGDTVRIGNAVSNIAGYCESNDVGACVTLVSINATEWIATSVIGTWTVV